MNKQFLLYPLWSTIGKRSWTRFISTLYIWFSNTRMMVTFTCLHHKNSRSTSINFQAYMNKTRIIQVLQLNKIKIKFPSRKMLNIFIKWKRFRLRLRSTYWITEQKSQFFIGYKVLLYKAIFKSFFENFFSILEFPFFLFLLRLPYEDLLFYVLSLDHPD